MVKVNEVLETSLSTLDHNTVGGFAPARFGRLPKVGDGFDAEGYRFEVAEMSERSIVSLTVTRIS